MDSYDVRFWDTRKISDNGSGGPAWRWPRGCSRCRRLPSAILRPLPLLPPRNWRNAPPPQRA
jgi:hypothetical protein